MALRLCQADIDDVGARNSGPRLHLLSTSWKQEQVDGYVSDCVGVRRIGNLGYVNIAHLHMLSTMPVAKEKRIRAGAGEAGPRVWSRGSHGKVDLGYVSGWWEPVESGPRDVRHAFAHMLSTMPMVREPCARGDRRYRSKGRRT